MDKFTAIITNGLTLLAKKIDSLALEFRNQKPPVVNVPSSKFFTFPSFPKYPEFPKIPTPIVNVNVPDVIFDASKIPPPVVNVAPNITVEKVEFPKEMEIKGMKELLASVSRETERESIFGEVSSKTPLPIIVIGKNGKQITDFGSEMTAPNTVGLRVGTTKVDSTNPLPITQGLNLPKFDYVLCTYTGNNPTTIVYKTGGSGGTTVATLTITYSGANIISITKT